MFQKLYHECSFYDQFPSREFESDNIVKTSGCEQEQSCREEDVLEVATGLKLAADSL